MYLNFGKIYDLNFKFNVAYYPIVGSNSILRHALRLAVAETVITSGTAVVGVTAVTGVTVAFGASPLLPAHPIQYFTNWIRKSSIPITISNI